MRTSLIHATIFLAIALTTSTCCYAQTMSPGPAPAMALPEGPSSFAYGPVVADPPTDPCMTALFNMSDCLSYVSNGSTTTKPDKACCPELAGLVEGNPVCLCKLLGNSLDIGIAIDTKRALKLPSACGVKTPDVSLCSAIGINVPGVPEGAPMAANDGTSSSPDGSPSSPSTTGADKSDGGCSTTITLSSSLAFALFISTFFF